MPGRDEVPSPPPPSRGPLVERLRGGLIVSCQAGAGHPLDDPRSISALARCAERGGAVAVRVEGERNVAAVRSAVSLPVMGIAKVRLERSARPFITPGFEDCRRLVAAGAAMVAVEATRDNRPDPREFPRICARVHDDLGVPVMADVSTVEEGLAASAAGADLVATTLSGYTSSSQGRPAPDLELVEALSAKGIRPVLEGRVRTPDDVARAFAAGAWSVVVGTAITDPEALTRRFAAAAPGSVRTARRDPNTPRS
ncbi:MAG TPA: putative N-acetylmannosamine-6-phosphate 2-epimerase [Actinopolymorphaceae bacterium]